MAEQEKRIKVLNLSKANRKFQCPGFVDETGRRPVIDILAGQMAVDIPQSSAAFLLGKKPDGTPRFPELVDAATFVPQADTKELEGLKAENAKLAKDNADLRAQLQAAGESAAEDDFEDDSKVELPDGRRGIIEKIKGKKGQKRAVVRLASGEERDVAIADLKLLPEE